MGKPVAQSVMASVGRVAEGAAVMPTWRRARVIIAIGMGAVIGLGPWAVRGSLYEGSAVIDLGGLDVPVEAIRSYLHDRGRLGALARDAGTSLPLDALAASLRVSETAGRMTISVQLTDERIAQRLAEVLGQEALQHLSGYARERQQVYAAVQADLEVYVRSLSDVREEMQRALRGRSVLGRLRRRASSVEDRVERLDKVGSMLEGIESERLRLQKQSAYLLQPGIEQIGVRQLSPWPLVIQRGLTAAFVSLLALLAMQLIVFRNDSE